MSVSSSKPPRVVLVTRPTEYEGLLARHATREQARFFLETRRQSLDEVQARHDAFQAALHGVTAAIPVEWRRSRVDRRDLDRFLFEPDDIVVAVGQDGLVANLAKYLDGQPVVGLNPEPDRNEGVLVPHPVAAAADLLSDTAAERVAVEERTMVEAVLDDGRALLALNELFVGQRTHQSARYRLAAGDREERQSSSGIIVCTGTGSTGWAKSIQRERATRLRLPGPTDPELVYFVREAWPSIATGTDLTEGVLAPGSELSIVSEMEDGVIFGDGIESDRIDFGWGRPATLRRARQRLRLVA